MRVAGCLLVAAMLASCSATGGASADGAASAGERFLQACRKLCTFGEALGCPAHPPKCADECSATVPLPVCRTEVLAYSECLATRTADDFVCGVTGTSTPKDGVCQASFDALVRCAPDPP